MKRERSRDSWASILVPLSLILGLVLLLSINVGQGDEKTFSGNPLEPWLKLLVGYMAAGAAIAAALVIGVAILRGLSTYLHQLPQSDVESPRLSRVG